jgi:hypothetical protein
LGAACPGQARRHIRENRRAIFFFIRLSVVMNPSFRKRLELCSHRRNPHFKAKPGSIRS